MTKIELCKPDVCTQCYACNAICPQNCITMVMAKDGFKIPKIDNDRCIECGACMSTCHRIEPHFKFQKPIKTYACWTNNLSDRERSSSGGAFSVIARKVLSNGGMVFGASMCDDLKVRHIGIDSFNELVLLQGSKYVQSYIGDTYNQVKEQLANGRVVLFSGTPCQVAGLYCFLHSSYDNLITVDVVCHGVPSQAAFDIYLEKIGLKNKCKNCNFRFTKGWGFQLSSEKVSVTDSTPHKKIISPKKSYYLRAFTKGLMFSDACYSCEYARPERVSDFTLADFWGIGDTIPFNHPTSKGISCLLVNNEKALEYIKGCDNLEYEERSLEEAIRGNYNLSHQSERPAGRDTYYEDSKTMDVSDLSLKYYITPTYRDYLRVVKQWLTNTFSQIKM